MPEKVEIVDVNGRNVDDIGLFCQKSKKKSEGYQRKLLWAKARFAEGMGYKILRTATGHNVGFIEYNPGRYAWRGIDADDYMVIHCLWVIGKWKGMGLGKRLLIECEKDAKKEGLKGVAVVASTHNWLAHRDFYLKNGFESVGRASPTFELLVKKFEKAKNPVFSEISRPPAGPGLTIHWTDQCPFLDISVQELKKTAKELGLKANLIEVASAKAARSSPCAYGTYCVCLDGKVIAYRPIGGKGLRELISER